MGEQWIFTDHINRIQRHAHNDSKGVEHEYYTLMMDNNDIIRLNSAQGDFLMGQLGTINTTYSGSNKAP